MKLTRDFYVPQSPSQVIRRAELNGVVYLYEVGKSAFACGFSGKRAKPDFHYRYSSPESREQKVNEYFATLANAKKSKLEWQGCARLRKAQFLDALKPGTILSGSWGYDQTQVEFYKVLERKANRIFIAELGHVTVSGSEGHDCCQVIPSETTLSAPIWKTVASDRVKIESCISLGLWDGTPKYKSWYR